MVHLETLWKNYSTKKNENMFFERRDKIIQSKLKKEQEDEKLLALKNEFAFPKHAEIIGKFSKYNDFVKYTLKTVPYHILKEIIKTNLESSLPNSTKYALRDLSTLLKFKPQFPKEIFSSLQQI